jgi:hypothetical protein
MSSNVKDKSLSPCWIVEVGTQVPIGQFVVLLFLEMLKFSHKKINSDIFLLKENKEFS